MAQGFSLNNQLFNRDTVTMLGMHFERAGVFASAPFVAEVLSDMGPLALKQRINHIATVLARHLPPAFPQAAEAILQALPPPLDPTRADNDFGHFIYAPLGVYVETHGAIDHRDLSLDLLEALTQRFSMEFSVRAFLNRWPDETLARMAAWADHPNYHVRRLVSEGTRPRLPWGAGITLDYRRALPLLDRLHADPTRYVTRSVSNHLNDITKFAPDEVLERLEHWNAAADQLKKELRWMRTHTLRGLIKAGHTGAMRHLGYHPDADVTVSAISIAPNTLARGDQAEVSVRLSAPANTPLIVDYVIDFPKAGGKTSSKTFKLKTFTTKDTNGVTLKKRHRFKDDATTFALHPGPHRLHLQINGRRSASVDFTLT